MYTTDIFGYGPFKDIGQEFDDLSRDIDHSFGNLPGKASLRPVRECATRTLDILAKLAVSIGTLEVVAGLQSSLPLKEWGAKGVEFIEIAYPIGTLITKETSLSVSYFTAIALSTGLAAMVASKTLRVHPQNEQARSLNAIRHLWSDFSAARKRSDWQVALNTLSTLGDLKKKYPGSFDRAMRPVKSWKKSDAGQFSRLKGFLHLHLYQTSKQEKHLVEAEEYIKGSGCLDSAMQEWLTHVKKSSVKSTA